jgi:hypothetical protein
VEEISDSFTSENKIRVVCWLWDVTWTHPQFRDMLKIYIYR